MLKSNLRTARWILSAMNNVKMIECNGIFGGQWCGCGEFDCRKVVLRMGLGKVDAEWMVRIFLDNVCEDKEWREWSSVANQSWPTNGTVRRECVTETVHHVKGVTIRPYGASVQLFSCSVLATPLYGTDSYSFTMHPHWWLALSLAFFSGLL